MLRPITVPSRMSSAGEQRRRAVALIVMRHCVGAALLHRQSWLGAVERLFAGRLGERQGANPLGHFGPKGPDPRRPGLLAQQAIDALLTEPSCQRQTAVLLLAVACMIAIVLSPPA